MLNATEVQRSKKKKKKSFDLKNQGRLNEGSLSPDFKGWKELW